MAISTAIPPTRRSRALGVEPVFRNLAPGQVPGLPQRVAVLGQGATASTYSTDKAQVFSAFETGSKYGFGSPLHLAVQQLLPDNGNGVGTIPVTVYPLTDALTGVAATGSITPVVTTVAAGEFTVKVNNIESQTFVTAAGDTVADIVTKITAAMSGQVDLPVTATDNTTDVGVTSKWKGTSANDIYVEIDGPTDVGVDFTIVQPTGGLVNPETSAITAALNQLGNVWETFIVNCFEHDDTDVLDVLASVNEGRWAATVGRFYVAACGFTGTTVSAAIAIPDARKTDRTNVQLTSVGSKDLPLTVAARMVALIVVEANADPAQGYGGRRATGLTPGADSDQWSESEMEAAFQGGSCTSMVIDNVVQIGDVITFYHPTGDPYPAYQYVVDIVRLQNIVYGTQLIFNADEWNDAPLIPDDQATTNPNAKKPSIAKAFVANYIDALGLAAIISDPATAKASIQAGISSTNPKRLDVSYTVALSGNTNIKSVTVYHGFYFGTDPVVG